MGKLAIFRKVSVDDRLPMERENVAIMHETERWITMGCRIVNNRDKSEWLNNDGFDKCNPTHWFESIEPPTHHEAIAEANRQAPTPPGDLHSAGMNEGFRRGAEWVLNRIKWKGVADV